MKKKENSAILQPTLSLTFVAALPTHCQWEDSMRWSLECQDRSFECDISKLRKRAAQNSQPPTVRMICIGRLMCFPPHPCLCFHVTTAWQPGKWDTGREKKRVKSGFCLSKKRTDTPNSLISSPSSGGSMMEELCRVFVQKYMSLHFCWSALGTLLNPSVSQGFGVITDLFWDVMIECLLRSGLTIDSSEGHSFAFESKVNYRNSGEAFF